MNLLELSIDLVEMSKDNEITFLLEEEDKFIELIYTGALQLGDQVQLSFTKKE